MLGHVDHGKPTLTEAIPAVLARKCGCVCSEYRLLYSLLNDRGLGLLFGELDCETDDRRYTLTDCAGHAAWVKSLLMEPDLFDAAILVVDAVEGPMPQTREQLLYAQEIGSWI